MYPCVMFPTFHTLIHMHCTSAPHISACSCLQVFTFGLKVRDVAAMDAEMAEEYLIRLATRYNTDLPRELAGRYPFDPMHNSDDDQVPSLPSTPCPPSSLSFSCTYLCIFSISFHSIGALFASSLVPLHNLTLPS
jgi:hypothetical protein